MKIQSYSLTLCVIGVLSLLTGCSFSQETTPIVYEVVTSSGSSVLTGTYDASQWSHIAYINTLSGVGLINGEPATQNAALWVGTRLETLTGGYMEIIFRDHSVFRLEASSILEIKAGGLGETKVALESGTLWARVLKPFTDTSFFTLETDDVSAGVRGTSVLLRVMSGSTQLTVIDTTSSGTASWGITWNDTTGWSGSLFAEERIDAKKWETATGKTKVDIKNLILDDQIVRENTLRDLRYMQALSRELDTLTESGSREKILAEMQVTLPTSDELLSFFRDQTLRDHMTTQLKQWITVETFLREIDRQDALEKLEERTDMTEEEKKSLRQDLIKDILPPPVTVVEPPKAVVKTPQKSPPPTVKASSPIVSGESRRTVSGE